MLDNLIVHRAQCIFALRIALNPHVCISINRFLQEHDQNWSHFSDVFLYMSKLNKFLKEIFYFKS